MKQKSNLYNLVRLLNILKIKNKVNLFYINNMFFLFLYVFFVKL